MRPVARAAVAVLLALSVLSPSAARADGARLLLAGALPVDDGLRARWGWSGAWLFPVGNRYDFEKPGEDGSPGFRVNRGLGGPEEGGAKHEGADLADGRGGDVVSAAAHGLVVCAAMRG